MLYCKFWLSFIYHCKIYVYLSCVVGCMAMLYSDTETIDLHVWLLCAVKACA